MTLRKHGGPKLTLPRATLAELVGYLGTLRKRLTDSLCKGQRHELLEGTHDISLKLAYLYTAMPGKYPCGKSCKFAAAALFNLANILHSLQEAGGVVPSNLAFTLKRGVASLPAHVLGRALGISGGNVSSWRKRIERSMVVHYQNFNYALFIQECRREVKHPSPVWYGFGSQEQATRFYHHFLDILDKEFIPPLYTEIPHPGMA